MTCGSLPIPLATRRCTKCGRGVANGATFLRRYEKGPDCYRSVCRDCDNARARTAQRIRRGWEPERVAAGESRRYTTVMPPAEARDDVATGGRMAPARVREPWEED